MYFVFKKTNFLQNFMNNFKNIPKELQNTIIDFINFKPKTKEELKKAINLWYKNKSKPYTLGICTYGPPGCGKTSFEKALAKMLGRHIIIIDISKFNTKDEADHVFFSEKLNDRIIPYDKRLYVFPDFDCQSKITNERTMSYDMIEKEDKDKEKVIIINKKKFAHDWIRTSTPYGTTPSRWRVYQFHHVGIFSANIDYFSFYKSPILK